MGKKDSKRSKNYDNQKSFNTLLQQCRKIIDAEIPNHLNKMLPYIQRIALEGHKNLLVRVSILEDFIIDPPKEAVTKEKLQALVIEKQDSMMGYTVTGNVAERGDTLRIKLCHRKEGEEKFTEMQDGMIQRLTKVHNPQTGTTQLFPEVEEALLGKVPGEEVVVTVEVDDPDFDDKGNKLNDKKSNYDIKVLVEKVMVNSDESLRRQIEKAQQDQLNAKKAEVESATVAETLGELNK